MTVSGDERNALCDLLIEVGPDAPTLCAGWRTRDLAAHLAIREHRADAFPGIHFRPFAAHTKRVQDSYAARPWNELVDLLRANAPWFWATRIGVLDRLLNNVEFFVHHEDIRRAQPGWQPRDPEPRRDNAIWTGVTRLGRLALRRSPVSLVLRNTDGAETVLKRGRDTVVVTGEPGELLLFAFGRDEVRLEFEGASSSITAAHAAKRGW